MSPPIRACELDEGIAPHQVSKFHTMAPISAPKMTRPSTMSGEMMPVPMVCATCKPKNRKAMKLKNAAQTTCDIGRKHARGDDRRDRIGGIVQAVEEVEDERDRDQRGQQHERICHR